MKIKKLIAVLFASNLILHLGLAASGAPAWSPDLNSFQNIDYTQGRELLYIVEEGADGGTGVMADPVDGSRKTFCPKVGPKLDCNTGKKVNIGGGAILPYCNGVIQSCLEKFEVLDSSGVYRTADFEGNPAGSQFQGEPSLGIPNGTTASIFKSEVMNSETNEYTVLANLKFWYVPSQSRFAQPNDFAVRVFATKPESQPGLKPTEMGICESTPDGKTDNLCGVQGGDSSCVYQDVDLCGKEVAFAASTSFRVTMILSNQVTGWFRGRLQKPDISVQPISDLYSRVTIAGDPVEVPRFVSTFDLSTGDPDVVGPLNENAHGGPYTLFDAPTARAMEILKAMRSKVNDTAQGISEIWSINSIDSNAAGGGSQEARRCLENQSELLGIVTTNAVAYTGTIPDYDMGYLSYKVAGLHYAPNGKDLNIGTYDLVMRSETARCLYGFTKAPISATVQVVGEQGAENIATTIVSEKDGWLKLAAYGFTFSEKEIQVKLTQPQNKTLTKFTGSTRTLSSKQKAEIKAVLTKAKGNPKFICTGVYVNAKDKATALKRARAACDYAKSLDKNHSYWAQAKATTAKSFDAKVMVVSK